MSLIVIDFTFLEGLDNEIIVKELAVTDFRINRVSSYVFKKSYGWEEVPMFNARMNQAMGVTGMMVMFHIQSWKLCYIAKYHLLLQFIALDLRKQTLLAV